MTRHTAALGAAAGMLLMMGCGGAGSDGAPEDRPLMPPEPEKTGRPEPADTEPPESADTGTTDLRENQSLGCTTSL